MSKIKAVIVEDNQHEMDNLRWKIDNNCPLVEVIASCRTGEEAITTIHQLQPDLLFLDVELGTMSGFDVLAQVQHIRFETIFTTGHNEYAIRAIKANALDYLLKPVDNDELVLAVNKVWGRLDLPRNRPLRLAIPIQHSLRFLDLDAVAYCEADDKHAIFYLSDTRKGIVSKRPLKEFEDKLPSDQFFRIHRSYIVNRDHVHTFDRSSGAFVTLSTGKKLSVAPSKKEAFITWLTTG